MATGGVLAHGIGVRGDLPIPVWMFAYVAGAALVISFLLLGSFWPKPKLEGRFRPRPLPDAVQPVARGLAVVLRLFGLAMFAVVLWASLAGDLGADATIAPVAVYVGFWVGLLFLSAAFGDVWRLLSPWETLALVGTALRRRFFGARRSPARWRPDPVRSGWLGVVTVVCFAALELVHPNPPETRLLGIAIAAYSGVMLAGASLWGREWLRHSDGFGVIFRHVGAMGIFCGDERGRLAVRPPVVGLANLRMTMPHAFVLLLMPGTTSFDGISRTEWWAGLLGARIGWETVGFGVFGLLQLAANFVVLYIAAMAVGGALTGTPLRQMLTDFAPSIVPIAFAYHIGHYFSLVVFEGQTFLALLSRPFGGTADLFGTAHFEVNYLLVSTGAIALVQAITTVAGHLAGVVLAHDKAVATFSPRHALRSQYGLLVMMLAFTVTGIFLLLNA
ncbi:MAG: fenitrothion hydrolase [Acidimicrobiia bacterium]|nr:fenitrothion hydrolase [Acidimicrobiia bacterium]